MRHVYGDSLIHSSRFDAMVYHDAPLHTTDYGEKFTADTVKIGENAASLIDDGCTLQMGIMRHSRCGA